MRGIHLTVGILSNVQPVLMQNAFEAVLEDEPIYKNTSLHVQVLPVLIYCDVCDKNTEVKDYKFVCRTGKAKQKHCAGRRIINKQSGICRRMMSEILFHKI